MKDTEAEEKREAEKHRGDEKQRHKVLHIGEDTKS